VDRDLDTAVRLDYQFSWRWLLPLESVDRVLLVGFTAEESAFWRSKVEIRATSYDDHGVAFLIVNNLLPDALADDLLHDVDGYCVIGSSKIVASWKQWGAGFYSTFKDYALIEPKNPRLVVPLGNSDWIQAGLSLHRPGRGTARVALTLLKILSHLGFDSPLRNRMLHIATRESRLIMNIQGAVVSGLNMADREAPKDFALYLGVPGEARKTVVLPLGGLEGSILKSGVSPAAQKALINEASTLRELSHTNLASKIPVVHNLVQEGGQVTLAQSYLRRQWVRRKILHKAVEEFLIGLSELNRIEYPLQKVVDDLNAKFSNNSVNAEFQACTVIRERLRILASSGRTIIGHRSHGDFSPWNCSWTKQGLFVFDWEDSERWAVALTDAFYYVAAVEIHVAKNANVELLEARAISFAKQIASAAGLSIDDVSVYWSLWLLNRMRDKPRPLYAQLIERLASSWA
jgi:hypothetical protein